MAQRDAVPMNGSDRIMIRGAPLWAGDAEWMVGKPRKHLAPDLDKDFLMDGTRIYQLALNSTVLGVGRWPKRPGS